MVITDVELENNKNLIHNLRTTILKKIERDNLTCDPRDIKKIKTNDIFIARFILFKKGNLIEALSLFERCLEWRMNTKVNDIKESSFPPEIFESKVLFPFNKDKEGNVIFMVSVKHHVQDSKKLEYLKRYLIYWGERMDRETKGGQFTVIFDLKDAGLSNFDLGLIKYLIELFKLYYPYTIANLLVFEMHWIFNAPWRIIKAILPPELVERTHFVDRTSILEYIDKQYLLTHMGGDCTDTFEFVPEEPIEDSNDMIDESQMSTYTELRMPEGRLIELNPMIEMKASGEPNTYKGYIELNNISTNLVAYKIKTNKSYKASAKNFYGIIEPNATKVIEITVQENFNSSKVHKFQVLAKAVLDCTVTPNRIDFNDITTEKQILQCDFAKQVEPEELRVEDRVSVLAKEVEGLKTKVFQLQKKDCELEDTIKKLLSVIILITFLIFISILYKMFFI